MTMEHTSESLRPRSWPVGVRVMLTAFLMLIGVGYLFAVTNIYVQYELADGKPGMSMDDLRAAYSGLTIRRSKDAAVPSRMLTMLRTTMRQYVDDERDFNVLQSWLEKGGAKAGLTEGKSKRTPERVIILNCLRCHAKDAETDISKKSPFGPDGFTVDYSMIQRFLPKQGAAESKWVHVDPQLTKSRLVLVTHMHMLAIPIFTLIVGGLFACARFPRRLRMWLTPLPMLAVVFDFAGWWLAREMPIAVYMIAAAGAIFGVVFGLQIIVVLIDLWRPERRSA